MSTPDSTPDDQLLTVAEASRELRISRWAIQDRIDNGQLPACKIGTGPRAPIRIRASDLKALLIPVVPKSARTKESDDSGGAP